MLQTSVCIDSILIRLTCRMSYTYVQYIIYIIHSIYDSLLYVDDDFKRFTIGSGTVKCVPDPSITLFILPPTTDERWHTYDNDILNYLSSVRRILEQSYAETTKYDVIVVDTYIIFMRMQWVGDDYNLIIGISTPKRHIVARLNILPLIREQ